MVKSADNESSRGGTTTTATESPSRPRLLLGGSGDGFDAALAERVRLFLKVTSLINVTFFIVFVITYFATDRVGGIDRHLIMFGGMAFNLMAWFLVAQSRAGAARAHMVANVSTLAMAGAYTHVVAYNPVDPNPTRTGFILLLGINFLLVLRASLIPSRTVTTALVSLASVANAPWIYRSYAYGSDRIFFVWLTVSALVVVVVAVVTSNAIYGLDRKARAAAQLGQYQVVRLLGRGGMGEVYLGQHALLHRPTAIKLLRDVSSTSLRRQFRKEVKAASALTHPNTVEIFDYGRTPDGIFYFAMEYVEGATLEEVVEATGAMPAARVVHLIAQAAGALGEAHGRGLVHRDVKPSNLMLCERGGIHDTLKVMDFGLVRDVTDEPEGGERALTGTPLYLAPEAILESDGATPQSDVYALGATAYFLLAGAPPFPARELVEILSDHLATPPPPLSCDDEELAQLVLRCLAKDPSERPADGRALLAELEHCDDRGGWREADAAVWWAEHSAVVAAHRDRCRPRDTKGRGSTATSLGRRLLS